MTTNGERVNETKELKKEFIKVIKENEGIILKVCNVYCKELADREDLYQDILIQLWKSFPKFKQESKVSTWIYRIALNTAISRFRKETKKPHQQDISAVSLAESPTGNDDVDLLYAAIESLNKIEKAIVMLYLDGLKYKEMGEVLGLSESNVGFKLNQIKKKLRELLKSDIL